MGSTNFGLSLSYYQSKLTEVANSQVILGQYGCMHCACIDWALCFTVLTCPLLSRWRQLQDFGDAALNSDFSHRDTKISSRLFLLCECPELCLDMHEQFRPRVGPPSILRTPVGSHLGRQSFVPVMSFLASQAIQKLCKFS